MGIREARHRVRGRSRGSPQAYAKGEIMVMREKRKGFFFRTLDLIVLVSLGLSIYSFYKGAVSNGFYLLIVAGVILGYYTLRNFLVARRRHK